MFRLKPEDFFYKFTGAKYETGTEWTSPYFWCVDPSSWLVTAMAPVWATNDHQYKNSLFRSVEPLRFVALSQVVLSYEHVDINQCPQSAKGVSTKRPQSVRMSSLPLCVRLDFFLFHYWVD